MRGPRRRTATTSGELAELRAATLEAQTVSRVLRGQLVRYEQLVRADSWRGVVSVALPSAYLADPDGHGLASCGHPANDDGECTCASWPELAAVPNCGHRRGLDGSCVYGSACRDWIPR